MYLNEYIFQWLLCSHAQVLFELSLDQRHFLINELQMNALKCEDLFFYLDQSSYSYRLLF